MSIFDKHKKLNKIHLINEGFEIYKEDGFKYSYYDFKSEIQYFPKNYNGDIRVYGKKPSDILCGWIGDKFKIIDKPDIDDVIYFKNLNGKFRL